MVTPAFLCLNIITILFNIVVGISLSLAEWDEAHLYLAVFALTCWGFIFMFQIQLLNKYIKQYLGKK